MHFKDIIKKEIENQEVTSRYVVAQLDRINNPVLISLATNEHHDLDIKIYETDYFSLKGKPIEYLENPFNKKNIIDYLMYGFVMDENNESSPRPICELKTSAWSHGVTLNEIRTREDMRRKGIGSFAIKLAQDYYSRNPNVNFSRSNMYADRRLIDEELKYKTRLEHETGKFGDVLSYVKSKILRRGAEEAYLKFLSKNNFACEKNPYQMPHRIIRSRDILDDKIINEETAPNYIQIFNTVLDFDPNYILQDHEKYGK